MLAVIECTHHANREAYGADRAWPVLNTNGIACAKHRVVRLKSQADVKALREQRLRWFGKTLAAQTGIQPSAVAAHRAMP
ncbi:hypothetical protein [Achromobacter deleyi]|uniref:hypothetical protein n=1 Tax=Achromobacter deleyi TaxID=1353891 RepID=UPI003CCCBE02